jgi:hypothetical protein
MDEMRKKEVRGGQRWNTDKQRNREQDGQTDRCNLFFHLSVSCICLLSCILKSEMSPWNLLTVRLSHIQISFATCVCVCV